MFDRFHQRSHELEHLDLGDYTPEEYEQCIIELQRVNEWLGDARALRHSLLRTVRQAELQSFSVLDVGAGSGELLRLTADWARKNNRQARLVGLELNARSARAIRDLSRKSNGIAAVRGDALRLPFNNDTFDYAICSLFTHHFADEQIIVVLRELSRVTRRQIFVIDLHRHAVAYYLFSTIGHLFFYNRLIREDGALSILRSFTPVELQRLAQRAGLTEISVERKFPYRLILRGRKRIVPEGESYIQAQAKVSKVAGGFD